MPSRVMTLPPEVLSQVSRIPAHSTLEHVPTSCVKRFAPIWLECLEGCAKKDETWCVLVQIRARLLLGCFEQDVDRHSEHVCRRNLAF